MPIVYLITNLANGKRYVGQTCQKLQQRWRQHISVSGKGLYYLHRAIRKYGDNSFIIKEIDRAETNELACYREMFWIAALQTYRADRGYNLTLGGEGTIGYKWTEDQLKKISAIRIKDRKWAGENNPNFGSNKSGPNNPMFGVHRMGKNAPRYGIPCTEDTKEKLRKRNLGKPSFFKGKKHTEETKIKMRKPHPTQVGFKQTLETKLKRSKSIKEWWAKRKQNGHDDTSSKT